LAGFHLRPGELMPVNEDVRGLKSGAVRVDAITILEVAFDFEIELLRKIPGSINARPTQTETIL